MIIKRKEEFKTRGDGDDFDSDSDEAQDIRLEMELGEGILKVELGIPIIVLCNKIDIIH